MSTQPYFKLVQFPKQPPMYFLYLASGAPLLDKKGKHMMVGSQAEAELTLSAVVSGSITPGQLVHATPSSHRQERLRPAPPVLAPERPVTSVSVVARAPAPAVQDVRTESGSTSDELVNMTRSFLSDGNPEETWGPPFDRWYLPGKINHLAMLKELMREDPKFASPPGLPILWGKDKFNWDSELRTYPPTYMQLFEETVDSWDPSAHGGITKEQVKSALPLLTRNKNRDRKVDAILYMLLKQGLLEDPHARKELPILVMVELEGRIGLVETTWKDADADVAKQLAKWEPDWDLEEQIEEEAYRLARKAGQPDNKSWDFRWAAEENVHNRYDEELERIRKKAVVGVLPYLGSTKRTFDAKHKGKGVSRGAYANMINCFTRRKGCLVTYTDREIAAKRLWDAWKQDHPTRK